ncbi:hydroxymethylbilane synthase [Sphingomonas sp. 1P06PA]|uniref:hydroxymethylbilane synthase n=1 Tax=Sphingomonas sp. 1P06PA TaxID=554121 RepID=UPI0039A55A55
MHFPFRIGTRGSPLALTQAAMTAEALRQAHGWAEDQVAIVPIKTTGDRVQDRPLADLGGKALWTKELDRALIAGEIDCAVHSMKDVETLRPAEIAIAAMLPRADVRDRLIGADSISALREGAVVGTSSPRRAAQLLRARPDLQIILFRGNVATRLQKLSAGEADATLLAAAGLDRLGLSMVGTAIDIEEMLPAPSQGAVGIETLAARDDLLALIGAIDDAKTTACVMAERALLAGLSADCRSPVAANAVLEGGAIRLSAEILSEDGRLHRRGIAVLNAPEDAAGLADVLLDGAEPELAALFRK